MKKKVGILALQGDFEAHSKALERAGAEPRLVRTAEDLKSIDGLVIPGGESTTMLKLVDFMELREPLMEFAREKPVFGTCAGAILLAIGLVGLVFPRNGGVEPDQDAAQEPTEKKANWKRERDNPDADATPLPPLPWRPPPQAR